LNRISSVIDWLPLLVIPNRRFPIPCRGWITLVPAITTASWHGLLAEPCMQSVVSVAFITAVSLALMTVWHTVVQQGFAHCRMQETQQTQQQAPALYRRQNAQQNHHDHCAMIPEPVVFS
jgi:ABC-type nickel/cobalt efflux system permease component RcnA